LKTSLKIIRRVKHASLFSPASYEENHFLILPHIMKARSSPKSGQPFPQIEDQAENYCKSKTRLLISPHRFKRKGFLTLPPGEIGEEEKKSKN
jgi:hypothetical protein